MKYGLNAKICLGFLSFKYIKYFGIFLGILKGDLFKKTLFKNVSKKGKNGFGFGIFIAIRPKNKIY